jgi:hypothetical protein
MTGCFCRQFEPSRHSSRSSDGYRSALQIRQKKISDGCR